MKKSSKQIADSAKQFSWNLILMATGSSICCAAVNGTLIPKEFFGTGFTGLSLIIRYLLPWLPLSLISLAFNIPLFVLGWRYVGRRFFLYSIVGMLLYTQAPGNGFT